MNERPPWQDPKTYGGYVKNFQQKYEHDPLIQASVQLIMSVFAVAMFIFLAIRPTLGTITTLTKKIEDQKLVDQKLDAKIAQLNNAQELLSTSGEEVGKLLGKAVPNFPWVDIWTKEIELLGVENQVAITAMEIDGFVLNKTVGGTTIARAPAEEPKTIAGKGVVISFNISGGGDGSGVQKFLSALGKMDRVVKLEQIEISKPESQIQGGVELKFSVRGQIFYVPGESGGETNGGNNQGEEISTEEEQP